MNVNLDRRFGLVGSRQLLGFDDRVRVQHSATGVVAQPFLRGIDGVRILVCGASMFGYLKERWRLWQGSRMVRSTFVSCP